MISTLIKQLMFAKSLSQKDLSDLLGVSIDRVKNITSGRVKNLTREEGEALIRKLNIRGDWLATGEGEMFQSAEEARAFNVMDKLGSASQIAKSLGLSPEQANAVMQLLFFAETGNAEAARRAIDELAGPSKTTLANEETIYQAVLDAVDLLSLEKKVDANQLAKAVVKLAAKSATPAIQPVAASKFAMSFDGATIGQHINMSGENAQVSQDFKPGKK